MLGSEYQLLASRTINNDLTKYGQEKHALHGIVGEIGCLEGNSEPEFKTQQL